MDAPHASRKDTAETRRDEAREASTAVGEHPTTVLPWLPLALATLLSFASTGYVTVSNNNIFHLGILLRSYDLPQLAGDLFVQSLRHFSSGFWLLFAGLGSTIPVEPFLAAWLVVAHAGFLAACAHLAASLGLSDRRVLGVLVLLLAVAPSLAVPAVGGGGLMLDYFTHSELANATFIVGLSLAIRCAWTLAVVALAATGFLNAFMAAWLAPLLAGIAVVHWRDRLVPARTLLRATLLGLLVGLPLVVPPAWNILRNPELTTSLAFSYRDFLWQHYPQHFFLTSLPGTDVARLLGVLILPVLALPFRDRTWRYAGMLVVGSVALLGLSVVAERLDSRMLLNLHLVRSAAVPTAIALTLVAGVAARGLVMPAHALEAVVAPLLAASLLAGRATFLWGIPVLLLLRLWRGEQPAWLPWLRPIAWLVLLGCLAHVPLRALGVIRRAHARGDVVEAGKALGAWAAQRTDPDDTFLLLPKDYGLEMDLAVGFTRSSTRSLWYSYKYGAAVMWTPSYHPVWSSRRAMLARHADTPAQKLAFARTAGVDVVVMECAEPAPAPPRHRAGRWCAYAVEEASQ